MLPRLSGIESMSCCSRAFSATAMHCRLLGGGTIVAIVRRLLDFPQLVNKEVWRLAFAVRTVLRVCKDLKFDIGRRVHPPSAQTPQIRNPIGLTGLRIWGVAHLGGEPF